MTPSDRPIVLIDGACVLCSRAARFIVDRDPRGRFRFASLQSATGRRLLQAHDLDPDALDTLVLLARGRAYTRSDAVLMIARRLARPWPIVGALHLLPRPLRDWVYDQVARRRDRWFGRLDACATPTGSLAARFID